MTFKQRLEGMTWGVVFVAAIVLTAILFAGYKLTQTAQESLRSEIESQLSAIATLKVGQIVQWRQERHSDGTDVMLSPSLEEAVREWHIGRSDKWKSMMLRQFTRWQTHKSYNNLEFFDTSGVQQAGLRPTHGRLYLQLLPWIREAYSTHEPVLTDVLRCEVDSIFNIYLVIPVGQTAAPDHQSLGVVVATIDASHTLYPLVTWWPLPSRTAETILCEREGSEVVVLNPLPHRGETALALRYPLSSRNLTAVRAVTGGRGAIITTDEEGHEVIAHLSDVPDSPWHLVAQIDTEEAFDPIDDRYWMSLLVTALVAAVAVNVLFYWSHRIRSKMLIHQAEAHDAQQKLAAIVESSADAIISMDLTGRVMTWNAGAEKLFGYAETVMVGRPITVIYPPGYENEMPRILEEIREGKSITEHETKRVVGSGATIDIQLSVSPLRGPDGTIVGISSIARDITELKKAEERERLTQEQLFRSREELELVIDNIPGLVFLKDTKNNFLTVNRYAAQAYGKTKEELYGASLFTLHPEAEARKYFKDDLAVIQSRTPIINMMEPWTAGGRSGWLLTSKMPIMDPSGNVERILGIALDVTETRILENRLEESETRYRAIFEQSPEGITATESDGRFVMVNSSFCDMTGYAEADLAGLRIQDLLTDQDTAGRILAPAGGPSPLRMETQLRRKDGTLLWASLSVSHLLVGGRGLVQCLVSDISRQKEAELALIESNKELEHFAYVASHDLQEPLRMVSSYTQLLAKRYKDKLDADANEFIDFAVDGAVRMQQLIHSLLEYSRLTRSPAPPVSVDCNAILDRVLTDHSIAISESGARIERGPLPVLQGTPGHLTQLFSNLIGNALKFRGSDPPFIRVTAERIPGMWEFAVADNGIGIESRYFDRIFAMFQRLHPRDAFPGTGIGLAICKKIVDRNGGRIWIESEPGKGTRFIFTYPA
jgi:PAS domain S-box-containing protein